MCARAHGRSLAKLGRGFSRRFTLQFFKERAGERLGPAFWLRRKVAAHVRQGRAGDRSRRAFGADADSRVGGYSGERAGVKSSRKTNK